MSGANFRTVFRHSRSLRRWPGQRWTRGQFASLPQLSPCCFLLSFLLFPALHFSAACVGEKAELQRIQGQETAFEHYLQKRIPALMEQYGVPGVSIALVQNGRIAFVESYGYGRLVPGYHAPSPEQPARHPEEDSPSHAKLARPMKLPLREDSPCRVESISKSVTAWGVMKLVQQGKINPDAPVSDYLKSWSFPNTPANHRYHPSRITVRHLLSNTSGLPLGTIGVRYDPDEKRPSLKEALSRDAIMQGPPGQSFSYSNTGFNLLELMIEEVTGLPFAEYMEREVLLPLGMRESSFSWKWDKRTFPNGFNIEREAIAPYVYPEKAAGGLVSTVEDIARFVAAQKLNNPGNEDLPQQDGGEVLPSSLQHRMYAKETDIPGIYGLVFDGYGLGHFLEYLVQHDGSDHRRLLAVSHGGQGSGWMSHYHSIPETGDGIVILTNSQRSWPLISSILSDWAQWKGFASIGMALIVQARPYLRVVIIIIVAAAILRIIFLYRSLKRSVDPGKWSGPTAWRASLTWIPELVVGSAILAVVGYLSMLPYFFLNSVFPVLSPYLGYSVALLGAVLSLSAAVGLVQKARLSSS